MNIKSATIGKNTLTMRSYQGIYYIVHNDLPVTNSIEFRYISELFDEFLDTIKKNNGKEY